MKVILLKDIAKVGKKDDIIEVNQGHAINFLIPRKLARAASSGDVKSVENKTAAHKKSVEEKTKQGRDTIKALNGEVIKISEKANEKGHLFSKIKIEEVISAVLEQTTIKIEKDWIKNFDQIKSVGEFKINLESFGEKSFILLNVCNR